MRGASQGDIKIFAGNSNPLMAQAVARFLEAPLGKCRVNRFSDGEVWVEIDESVRGQHTFVLQSTSPRANEQLMELLVVIDALKRASADEITAVIPYYGYARQDRKVAPRAPITAKLVADLLSRAGATRVISMDLHAGQIQGFFDIPFDHLYAMPVMLQDLRERFFGGAVGGDNDVVIVAPDAGGVERARAYAKRLQCTLAIIDKRRTGPNVAEVMNILGDVDAKRAIIIDDMVDTAGTLAQAARAVVASGAKDVWAYATHAVLSGPALERISGSPLKELVVTDTITPRPESASSRIRTVSIAPLVGEAIKRVHTGESISTLFT
jgi:ribose-phosphate pyrophosphokinase